MWLEYISIARKRLAKHVPAEAYRGKIGLPFPGNGVLNTPTNCLEAVFSLGSVLRLHNAEFQVSSPSGK
jgi:hypothetical protein